ncbi:MAG TPA: tRNA (guanosine(46)-N7)-methyltransferase TrmB [Burkholderiales bacterium]|nr:tRNA (guanosine(46)-N7)-methyltransferase TrmB [Burkholderiales bacterium]
MLCEPAASSEYTAMRTIRSFVLRQGRISKAQSRAYRELLPKYGVPYSEGALNLDRLFGRNAPKILEIGFGMGESSAVIAQANPQHDYLGIEVHTPGVGSLLNKIEAARITNFRVIQHDATEVVRNMIPPASLYGIHIFFPDPWPKRRHHKRRLIQPDLVALLCERLKTGGYLHLATDWKDYAEHILSVLGSEPQLANTARDYAQLPKYRPLTKFEQRGLRLGHPVWDIVFTKL